MAVNILGNLDGKSKIYMIGSLYECPVKDRDDQCCYKAFTHVDLKTVAEMIEYIPTDVTDYLAQYCSQCSSRKYLQSNCKISDTESKS